MKSFLLAQRACIEDYPPTLNQAVLLSQIAEVTALDAIVSSQDGSILTTAVVKRVRVRRKAAASLPGNVLARLNWVRQFYHVFSRQIRNQPAVAIAYDPEAIFWLLRSKRAKNMVRIAHLHELPLMEYVTSSSVGRFALRATMKRLHRADLVVMPDLHRAQWLQKKCGLKELPTIVMNCPRRLETLPESRLLPWLRERGIATEKIVHYQGAVGSDHNFERLIASMQFWPPDSVFVIVGGGPEGYIEQLRSLAREQGVEERLLFVGRVPYSEVFSYAVGASVGLNFLNDKYAQFKYSAGASNKRFEYVALGIPQVTNPLPGVRELFEQPGVATTASYDDAEAIGKAIRHWLENDELRRRAFHKARALHLKEYNYERQMQPLLEKIVATTGSRTGENKVL